MTYHLVEVLAVVHGAERGSPLRDSGGAVGHSLVDPAEGLEVVREIGNRLLPRESAAAAERSTAVPVEELYWTNFSTAVAPTGSTVVAECAVEAQIVRETGVQSYLAHLLLERVARFLAERHSHSGHRSGSHGAECSCSSPRYSHRDLI